MKWISRERPKIDRIACPWSIKKFISPKSTFQYIAASDSEKIGLDAVTSEHTKKIP